MKYHDYGRRSVRIREVKKIAVILLMSGFLAGIIYVNLIAKKYVVSMGIFSDYFLEQYAGSRIHTGEYIWYVMKVRTFPIVVILFLGNTRFRRMAGCFLLIWTGFAGGIVFTTAVLKMSIMGIFLCLIGIMPHFICYIAAYMLILIYLFAFPESKWNSTKTVSLLLFLILGIITNLITKGKKSM